MLPKLCTTNIVEIIKYLSINYIWNLNLFFVFWNIFFTSITKIAMLFDFLEFVQELRENEEKKEIVEKYEKLFGPITWDMKDQNWYKEYLYQFQVVPYKIPKELEEDFDREMLIQLVCWSFSSDYELKKEEKDWETELFIAVQSGDQSVVKTISELRSFQVLRLYEIYVEEQINLHTLKYEDESEKDAIDQERDARIQKWKAVLDTMNRWEKVQESKKEQESKLSDLMGKL